MHARLIDMPTVRAANNTGSLCITLPKAMVKAMKIRKGDIVGVYPIDNKRWYIIKT